MRMLLTPAGACFLALTIASVGYAESQAESAARPDQAAESAEATGATADHQRNATDRGSLPRRSELSVAPLDHVEYPPDRPSWLEREPDLQSEVHSWVVNSGGCETTDECEAQLEVLQRAAVSLYIRELTGWTCDESWLNQDWIEQELVGRRYVGSLTVGDQSLTEQAVELQFDATTRGKIRQAARNDEVGERLRATGGFFVLGLVGLIFTGGVLGAVTRRVQ